MPVKDPCTKCRKACKENVREGDESICCDKCNKWVHFRCTDLPNDELNLLISTDNLYTCDRCLKTCLKCEKVCRINQKVHICKMCKQHIHEKCKTDEYGCILDDPVSGSPSFFCCNCSLNNHGNPNSDTPTLITTHSSEHEVLETEPAPGHSSNGSMPEIGTPNSGFVSLNSSYTDTLETCDDEISDAHSSDFEFESDSESDSDLRGLDFSSLPAVQNTNRNSISSKQHQITLRTINYKYPCSVCLGPCRENTQDSIQCTLCDEWVHQKCTNLTYSKFLEYCDPNNGDKPYHCDWCEFGSTECRND